MYRLFLESLGYAKDFDLAELEIALEAEGRFEEFTATFEATLAPGITGAALEIAGTEGRLYIDRNKFDFFPKGQKTPVTVTGYPPPDRVDGLTQDHVNNFLDCVRSRKLPNGDVLIGHRSAQASHLGNISYVQRRRIDFDADREEILPF